MNSYLTGHNKNDCYGCTACYNICPKGAIGFSPDEEGFLYPVLNKDKCVRCGCCKDVCPYDSSKKGNTPLKVYGFVSRSSKDLYNSSSGGAFISAANYYMDKGELICGCIFDELIAVHRLTDDPKIVKRMQGSKYVQSNLDKTFIEIRKELENGREVLFTGTPCQVDGLKHFLRKPYDNLVTIDLICHGVPSPLLLSEYVGFEYAKGRMIEDIKFRDKRNGWRSVGTIKYIKKGRRREMTISPFNNGYYQLYYLKDEVNRVCCYSCKYANDERIGDITIGDLWNADMLISAFDFTKGVSAVMVNTEQGLNLFKKIQDDSFVQEISIDDVKKCNGNLIKPCNMPDSRATIYSRINKDGLQKVFREDCSFQYIKPRIKQLFPRKVKAKIKKLLLSANK